MTIKKVKGILTAILLTIGVFSVCPATMFLESKRFDAFVAQIKEKAPTNVIRTLAIVEVK